MHHDDDDGLHPRDGLRADDVERVMTSTISTANTLTQPRCRRRRRRWRSCRTTTATMPVTIALAASSSQAMTPVMWPSPKPRTTYSSSPPADGYRAPNLANE